MTTLQTGDKVFFEGQIDTFISYGDTFIELRQAGAQPYQNVIGIDENNEHLYAEAIFDDNVMYLTSLSIVNTIDINYFIKGCFEELKILFNPDKDFKEYKHKSRQVFTKTQAALLNDHLDEIKSFCKEEGINLYFMVLTYLTSICKPKNN